MYVSISQTYRRFLDAEGASRRWSRARLETNQKQFKDFFVSWDSWVSHGRKEKMKRVNMQGESRTLSAKERFMACEVLSEPSGAVSRLSARLTLCCLT